jgi:hypothetical protein
MDLTPTTSSRRGGRGKERHIRRRQKDNSIWSSLFDAVFGVGNVFTNDRTEVSNDEGGWEEIPGASFTGRFDSDWDDPMVMP